MKLKKAGAEIYSDASILACPKCGAHFTEQEDVYKCSKCGEHWKKIRQLAVAPNYDSDHYYGELPRSALQYILQRANVVGPTRALGEWCRENSNHYVYRHALDLRRALFMEFLEHLNKDMRVLDYGCGLGSIGLAFAKVARTVYFVDSIFERCLFAQLRAEEMGFSNMAGIVAVDWRSLPIPKESLDLVVLNGVVEWIPETVSGDPLQVQLGFIKDMKHMLRERGAMYIGIENRFALRYFAGYPDDHTNTKFTSVMPRRVADLYCRWRTGKPYRTLTWSLGEYRRNLMALGFRKIDFIYPHPDYRFPELACSLEDANAVISILRQHQGRKANLAYSVLHRIGVLPHFLYSYGIIAYL